MIYFQKEYIGNQVKLVEKKQSKSCHEISSEIDANSSKIIQDWKVLTIPLMDSLMIQNAQESLTTRLTLNEVDLLNNINEIFNRYKHNVINNKEC